jgi:formylmethanofuran dehydrogenase subunit A
MFALPRYVLKAGDVVLDDGELRNPTQGSTWHAARGFDDAVVPGIKEWFDRDSSLQFANFPLGPEEFPGAREVSG